MPVRNIVSYNHEPSGAAPRAYIERPTWPGQETGTGGGPIFGPLELPARRKRSAAEYVRAVTAGCVHFSAQRQAPDGGRGRSKGRIVPTPRAVANLFGQPELRRGARTALTPVCGETAFDHQALA